MYFNTLIIMNEDTAGYGRKSRNPSGYCKLAMPNRVICYVQGLQQLPKGQVYRLYLMSHEEQRSVEVGMFQVGPSGNRELRWTITPDDINNSGIRAGEVDGALVVVDGEGVRGPVAPLVGFVSEPYSWRGIMSPQKEEQSKVTQVEPTPGIQVGEVVEELVIAEPEELVVEEVVIAERQEPVPEEVIVGESQELAVEEVVIAEPEELAVEEVVIAERQEPVAEEVVVAEPQELVVEKAVIAEPQGLAVAQRQELVIEDDVAAGITLELEEKVDEIAFLRGEIERLNTIIEQSRQTIESLQENLSRNEIESEELEPTQQITPGNFEELKRVRDIKEDLETFISRFQSASKEAYKASNGAMEKVFTTRIPMNPFPEANDGIKWVRITHEDLASFSQLSPEWVSQPFILDAHRKYKHLILGKDEASICYYVGIPDVFSPERSYILDTDRIERFSCRHNVPVQVGEVGYWIALI